MNERVAISVQNVSKAYRIWPEPTARLISPALRTLARFFPGGSRLRAALIKRAESYYRDFFALKNISFEVRRGESVGIIGRNGSGKSTLLQIIVGTLTPTSGAVKVYGRVAALLELGSGFNPEFTGRENVFLNGTVLGLSRRQIEERFDSIAAFADIGDFIEQPVKIYSSGMILRLAFAVQTAVEPDVLIVDEALSVGDAPFQAKCFAEIRRLQSLGCTILFVSHDIGTVRTFCQQAVWLSHGVAQAQGAANEVCGAYSRDCSRAMGMNHEEPSPEKITTVPAAPAAAAAGWLHEGRSEYQKNAALRRSGNGRVRLLNFFLIGESGQRTTEVRWDEDLTAVYVLGSAEGYSGLFRIGLTCVTLQGAELLSCSDRKHQHRLDLPPGGEQIVTMRLRLPLRSGEYSLYSGVFLFPDDAVFPEGTLDFTRAVVADSVSYSAFVSILPQFNLGIYGPVHVDTYVTVHS
jgi:lipopolysaccharide transport system ATP-binding protein